MAENVQLSSTTGALLNDINSILAARTLEIAQNELRFYQLGEKLQNADGTGKIWKAIRYNRVNLPRVTLTEGTTPDGSALTTTAVTGTAEQWGAYISLSDVDQLVLAHPVLQKSNELLGINAAEVLDREVQNVLESATTLKYGDAVTGRAAITATGILGTTEVATMVSTLRNNGARPFDGQYYVGIIDPSVEMDMILDTQFVAAAEYSNIKALYNGEVGMWMGVRWIRSNFVRTYYGLGVQTGISGAGGTLTTGSYAVKCVGYDSTYRLKMSISNAVDVVVTIATGTLNVTTPNSPTGYKWDIYSVAGSGGTPLKNSATGEYNVTGGSSVTVSAVGTGAAAPAAPLTGLTVHNVWVFGKGGFGVTELTGIQRTLTDGKATDSDPLAQRRKTGWKAFFKAIILDDNNYGKTEVASNF